MGTIESVLLRFEKGRVKTNQCLNVTYRDENSGTSYPQKLKNKS